MLLTGTTGTSAGTIKNSDVIAISDICMNFRINFFLAAVKISILRHHISYMTQRSTLKEIAMQTGTVHQTLLSISINAIASN